MRKLKNSKAGTMTEVIEIESDTEEVVGDRTLALCNEGNTSRELVNVSPQATNMQIVCVDDDEFEPDLNCDMEYMKFLAISNEIGNLYLLEDSLRDDSPLRIMYSEESGKKKVGRKAKSSAVSSISKRFKTESGRKDRKTKKEKHKQKKEVTRRGKKIALTVNTTTERRKVGRPRKYPVSVENNIQVSKKNKNEKSNKRKYTKYQAPAKRLKTENGRVDCKAIQVVNTQRKKVEAQRGRKITMTNNNLETMSITSHGKAREKEDEKSISLLDKSYAYYLAYLKNSITIFDAERQVKAVTDIVALSDPDIVAVSDRPFVDGGRSLFETNKDRKVIDVEDAIDILNSSFSTKLMELLRKPYDKEDLVTLYEAASVKRPLTRSRQLRDGREIEYNVHHQFAPSLLDQYPDFNKKLSHHRKDALRALNLLRGFLFYLENLTLEGAFKPWRHEEQLQKLCFDASECKSIEYTPHCKALES